MRVLPFPGPRRPRPLDPARLWAAFALLTPAQRRVILELMMALAGAEDDDGLSWGAMPGSNLSAAPVREAARQRWRTLLAPHWSQLRRRLSEREAIVLGLRLGLAGAPLTQERVARRLGLAVGSIAPIEKRALAKIRAALDRFLRELEPGNQTMGTDAPIEKRALAKIRAVLDRGRIIPIASRARTGLHDGRRVSARRSRRIQPAVPAAPTGPVSRHQRAGLSRHPPHGLHYSERRSVSVHVPDR